MTNPIKILVFCAGKSALPSCQLLHLDGYLAGIVLDGKQPEVQSLFNESFGNQFPRFLIQHKRDYDQLALWLTEIGPTALFSIAFPYLIPDHLLEQYPRRWINFHMGKLPDYRGPMPIFEALKAGEEEAVLTVHLMDRQYDTGEIIWEEEIGIDGQETFGSLAIKFTEQISLAAQNTAQMLQFGGELPVRAQPNSSAYCPFPTVKDTSINWAYMNADEIVSLCQACNPWNGGADTSIGNLVFKVLKAEKLVGEEHYEIPGKILSGIEPLAIGCVDGEVVRIQLVSSDYGIELAKDFSIRLNQSQLLLGKQGEEKVAGSVKI